jgi:predicted DCC family thiol-disulfide oxidoreductase YuxK
MSSPITDTKMVLVYDGECPFCRNYVRLMSLRKAVGDIELVDARTLSANEVGASRRSQNAW